MHLTSSKWEVSDMTLNHEKILALWKLLQRHRTLFSDLTWCDVDNFVRSLMSSNTIWLEVREAGTVVGVIWFDELHTVTDAIAHLVFFDRMPTEKVDLCKAVIRWMFERFPLHRLTVTPPAIYFMTVKLLKRLGFTQEGRKREAVLIGGEWRDQLIFGITRNEVMSQ